MCVWNRVAEALCDIQTAVQQLMYLLSTCFRLCRYMLVRTQKRPWPEGALTGSLTWLWTSARTETSPALQPATSLLAQIKAEYMRRTVVLLIGATPIALVSQRPLQGWRFDFSPGGQAYMLLICAVIRQLT